MENMILLGDLIKITNDIRTSKYQEAKVIFPAGSIVRGEGTSDSDLDLVIVFEHLLNAYRKSFYYGGFPVKAFVHDPETLNCFIIERELNAGENEYHISGRAFRYITSLFAQGLREIVRNLPQTSWNNEP